MSDPCCAPTTAPNAQDSGAGPPRPWWRDPGLMLPALSGVALVSGLALGWAGLPALAGVMFWAGLLLGASTFVPGALLTLVRGRRLGIALLMSISAAGAVILGYIEEAAALAFLYSLAEALEHKAMDRARAGLRSLLTLMPDSATVVRGGIPREVPARELRSGDMFRVKPGERIATDGTVTWGASSLDNSAITGESIPVDITAGDQVFAGAINTSGALEVTAGADGTDNTLTTLVGLVEQAQQERGERARLADRIARPLIPGVIVLATLVGALGSIIGDPETWITRALVVLVAASPCAIAIAVPVTVVSAVGAASKFGVIIKSGAAFERLGTVRRIAIDKTGTLTENRPTVTRVVETPGATPAQVLSTAAALEQHSTHPLAAAIVAAAHHIPAAEEVTEQPGQGLTGSIDGHAVAVHTPRRAVLGAELAARVQAMEDDGQTCVLVTREGAIIGAIGVRDELRPEAPEAVQALRDQEIDVAMLTGDNVRTATALAKIAGITEVRADLRPEGKARVVTDSVQLHPTAMIGDGINDAPALATATVGIAMGATGSDAAVEAADIAFTGHDLRLIPQALRHARRGRRIMNQNIALSLAIIIALVPLAIAGTLSLAAVVAVHEAAEVVIIINGLRAARTRPMLLLPRPGVDGRGLDTHPARTATAGASSPIKK